MHDVRGDDKTDVDKQSLGPRIADLLESRQEVLEAYLFGSHARGGAQPHSDIDVAVYIDDAHEDRSVFGLRAELSTLLIEGLRENGVDLLVLNHAIDVATHPSSSAGLDAPDYATAIDRLAELGVMPAGFTSVFRNVAGFRNVLVHGYLDVGLDVIEQIPGTRLSEFETFAHHIEVWLGGRTG